MPILKVCHTPCAFRVSLAVAGAWQLVECECVRASIHIFCMRTDLLRFCVRMRCALVPFVFVLCEWATDVREVGGAAGVYREIPE